MGLFDRVQEILDGHFTTKQKVTKHEFAFSGLVSCGHCGCALVAKKKKGKYVYYHCTGNKGKCAEPYAREEFQRPLSNLAPQVDSNLQPSG